MQEAMYNAILKFARETGAKTPGCRMVPDSILQTIQDLCVTDRAAAGDAVEAFMEASNPRAPIGERIEFEVYSHEPADEYSGRQVVSISIQDGETVRVGISQPHDEGYSHQEHVYSLSDGKLYLDIASASSDCDGRYEDFRSLVSSETVNGNPIYETVSEDRRDHTAEAAGY